MWENPVSIFMAGSPGAGKTEVSQELVKEFDKKPLRIDADEIRTLCPGYNGINAHLFQKAANKGVNILYDYAFKGQKCHVILDGTFAYGGSVDNIKRSLKKGRKVEIWFVYQAPVLAWRFTKAREKLETRHVMKDTFIDAFFKSKQNVIDVKNEFKESIKIHLLVKDINNKNSKLHINIQANELDDLIGKHYTKDTLNQILR